MAILASVVVSFVALFVVVEPFGALPLFASLTSGRSRADQIAIAYRASVVGALILIGFAIAGRGLLGALGVRLDAFQVAGGVVLLLAALDVLRGRPGCRRCSDAESDPSRADVAIVPIAIPMLAGPSAMAATMSLVTREPLPAVLLAILGVFAVSFLVLRSTAALQRLIGPAVLAVVVRVLGLLLAALSIQSIVRGVASLVTWAA
ncbi:MAG TPA: MarC family protein [Kofleriaceae bacterium]|nr:MarC family protein [Kofleriaceae bacterium]